MPKEDENQKELMKPIGFDDRIEWVMVGSEERKYVKRFEKDRLHFLNIAEIMRDKLGTLNAAEREQFYKEAPNIVSRLKEETQTFKDARYAIQEILRIEEEKEDLIYEKDIYEIFELFVLENFHLQRWRENFAFAHLKSHEEIWLLSFLNRYWCANLIDVLKGFKGRQYTTNFYFRCFISQLTAEGWIHTQFDEFVSEDLKFRKLIPGKWVDNPRAEIWSYEIENEDKKHEMLYFSHYEQIPLERIIEAFEKEQKRIENVIKLYLKYMIPIEDSEKNNVPFNIESLLDEASEYESFYRPHPFPHYLFQLRNPPRSICQKNHSGKCQMDGFRKMREYLSDFPKEVHIPVCGEITENEALFLDSYMNCTRSEMDEDPTYFSVKRPFLFLCCQNLLDIPFLILLDHPNNYENGESILGLDFKRKLHHIDVGVLREYLQESKLNERVYALLERGFAYLRRRWAEIRLIDYQGNPKTEWLDFERVSNSAFYSPFTNQQEARISSSR